MQPVFTILKEEGQIHVDLIPQLNEFCSHVHEFGNTLVLVPNPGTLYHVFDLLKESKVEYDLTFPEHVDFDSADVKSEQQ